MRLVVPITGTVLDEARVVGSNDDPIRPIALDFRNVSWKMMELDLEGELAVIEIEPSKLFFDGPNDCRPATLVEQQKYLDDLWQLVKDKMPEELYALSGSPKLKKPKRKP